MDGPGPFPKTVLTMRFKPATSRGKESMKRQVIKVRGVDQGRAENLVCMQKALGQSWLGRAHTCLSSSQDKKEKAACGPRTAHLASAVLDISGPRSASRCWRRDRCAPGEGRRTAPKGPRFSSAVTVVRV